MKNTKALFIITFAVFLIFSCEKQKSEGFIHLSFSNQNIETGLKSASSDESKPKFIVITVVDAEGEFVFNTKKLELIKLGEGYLTEKIELLEGEYTVEDFIVLNEHDSAILITPKVGSEFEDLVTHPLPYAFAVSPGMITDVILDVIPAHLGTASDYGYAVFSFNIVKSITIQPGAEEGMDAYIEDWPYENYSNRNFGLHEEFQASAWTGSGTPLVVRNLIKFNLEAIPADAVISSANLVLFGVDNTINGPGHSKLSGCNAFELLRVTSDWDELSVTWNTQPSTSQEGKILLPGSDSTLQDYKIDITPLIQAMAKDPEHNFGLMMKLQDEYYYRRILFASSDHADQLKHPKLVITFR